MDMLIWFSMFSMFSPHESRTLAAWASVLRRTQERKQREFSFNANNFSVGGIKGWAEKPDHERSFTGGAVCVCVSQTCELAAELQTCGSFATFCGEIPPRAFCHSYLKSTLGSSTTWTPDGRVLLSCGCCAHWPLPGPPRCRWVRTRSTAELWGYCGPAFAVFSLAPRVRRCVFVGHTHG